MDDGSQKIDEYGLGADIDMQQGLLCHNATHSPTISEEIMGIYLGDPGAIVKLRKRFSPFEPFGAWQMRISPPVPQIREQTERNVGSRQRVYELSCPVE